MARAAINSSAIHVFEVLRLIARTDESLGVSEISRRLGLPASTVYRALITLEESGYIARDRNMPRYILGQMPQLLNRGLVHRFKLHAASRPHLRVIAERTGETASLIVRLGWYGLRLAGIYGNHDIYHRDRLGEVMPLHMNAAGLAILAFLRDAEQEAYRAFAERQRATGAWDKAVADAQATGFADTGQGAAFPVRNPAGEVLASIAISAGDDRSKQVGLEVRDLLEADIAKSPASFDSPFAHIPADRIVLDMSRISD